MDKAVFCCAGQHLHHLACCGQALLRSAPPTGIKARVPHRLWTSALLCRIYPPGCPWVPRKRPFSGNRPAQRPAVYRGVQRQGHPPHSITNLRALQGAERGLAAHRQGPRDLQRDQAGFWRGPPAPCCLKKAGGCCSLRYLYFNSSSSRARRFLWISGFSCGVTVVCSVSKSVGRGLLPVRAALNNFRRWAVAVDKWPLVPAIHTDLSTGLQGAAGPTLAGGDKAMGGGRSPGKKMRPQCCGGAGLRNGVRNAAAGSFARGWAF